MTSYAYNGSKCIRLLISFSIFMLTDVCLVFCLLIKKLISAQESTYLSVGFPYSQWVLTFSIYVFYLVRNAQVWYMHQRTTWKAEFKGRGHYFLASCCYSLCEYVCHLILLVLLCTLSSHFDIAGHCSSFLAQRNFADISYGGDEGRLGEKLNIKALVSRIREQVLVLLNVLSSSISLSPSFSLLYMCMSHGKFSQKILRKHVYQGYDKETYNSFSLNDLLVTNFWNLSCTANRVAWRYIVFVIWIALEEPSSKCFLNNM